MSNSMLRKPPPVVDLVVQPDHARHSGLHIYRKSEGRQRFSWIFDASATILNGCNQRRNFEDGCREGDSPVYDGA